MAAGFPLLKATISFNRWYCFVRTILIKQVVALTCHCLVERESFRFLNLEKRRSPFVWMFLFPRQSQSLSYCIVSSLVANNHLPLCWPYRSAFFKGISKKVAKPQCCWIMLWKWWSFAEVSSVHYLNSCHDYATSFSIRYHQLSDHMFRQARGSVNYHSLVISFSQDMLKRSNWKQNTEIFYVAAGCFGYVNIFPWVARAC